MFGGSDIARRNRYLLLFPRWDNKYIEGSEKVLDFLTATKKIILLFRKDLSTYVGINTDLSVDENAGIRRENRNPEKTKNNNNNNNFLQSMVGVS